MTITAETLDSIHTLYRDFSGVLWALPCPMDEGEEPPVQPGASARSWLWLGTPGNFGRMTWDEECLVQDFIADAVEGGWLPFRKGEWITRARGCSWLSAATRSIRNF